MQPCPFLLNSLPASAVESLHQGPSLNGEFFEAGEALSIHLIS
jgi:hypothetical protein